MRKKVVAALLAVGMVATLLTGCGSSEGQQAAAEPAATTEATVAEETTAAEEAPAEEAPATELKGAPLQWKNFVKQCLKASWRQIRE